MFNADNITIWVGVVCTLAMYSILYRENKLYRFFEHIYIGIAMGYGLAVTYTNVVKPRWIVPTFVDGRWWWMGALLVASMYFFIYSKKYNWVSRMIILTMFGITAGLGLKGFIIGNMPQVLGSFKTVTQTTSPYLVFNGIVFLVVILSVLTYFFFSVEHSKHPTVRRSANFGRWFIMVYLGAIFGTTVMGRMSLFIQRLMFLLEDFPRTFGGG